LSKEAVPTKAGELLFGYARRMLVLKDEADAAMADFNGKIKGKLAVGGSTIPGTYLLPRVIGMFSKRYPEVKISLLIADTQQIISDVLAGIIELGIVGAKIHEDRIIQNKLVEDDLRLIIPANHAWSGKTSVSLKELLKEPFIVREPGSGTLKSLQQSLTQKKISLTDLAIISELGSTEAVCQGIKGGLGISILSTLAVSDDLQAGRLKALNVEGLNLKRNFYLIQHKQRTASPLGRSFIDYLKQELCLLAR
jgi:DNA-binding transcriptional LysR family regulator